MSFVESDLSNDSPQRNIPGLRVMKFGGTSVGSSRAIEETCSILAHYYQDRLPLIAVVSAMSGVTNRLAAICEGWGKDERKQFFRQLQEIFDVHLTTVSELRLSNERRSSLQYRLRQLFLGLRQDLEQGFLNEPFSQAKVLSYGERLSCRIIEAQLMEKGIPSLAVDALDFLITNNNYLEAHPDFPQVSVRSNRLLVPYLEAGVMPVVTGFIGRTSTGEITLLGRGGSDYTASILGRTLQAAEVWIWTDVDGVFDRDPRQDPNAKIIPEMSFEAADLMAKAGAKVLFMKTIEPLKDTRTLLWVKNTFNPDSPGTKIWRC